MAETKPTFVEKISTSYFGGFLVSKRMITQEDLERALKQQEKEPHLRIGEILVRCGCLTNRQLFEALKEQRLQIRIGEFLIYQGALGFLQMLEALEEQSRTGKPLGTILVELGFCEASDIEEALDTQRSYVDEYLTD
jgi:hypothetical protein